MNIINHNLQIKVKRYKYEINSPKYLGAAILAYSKMLMLDFVYHCLSTIQTGTYKIQYTDTDSLYLRLHRPETWEEFYNMFSTEHQQRYFQQNKADLTPGKMKVEKIYDKVIFLRPKCYCFTGDDLEKYEKALNHDNIMMQQKITKNTGIKILQKQIAKKLSNTFDNKRIWTDNNTSLPYELDYEFSKEKIVQNIIKNYAQRVNISVEEFLQYLGTEITDFAQHLEDNFTNKMNWLNYGNVWNIDHEIPISAAETTHRHQCI